ncbi:TetR/AcrR family transcriptional regulator [Actinopolymorpha alba]|uniref:TetR/AcrR family transcriptional regulator n=1 Tax=Actinopolymorpha alba TaxID=533267 RepID=UPI000382371F|nr:TetR/AcrR family transcriptional regulator [Actinopolymorpha alba]
MGEQEVPAALGRLWRVSAGYRLGRPAALDVERVVRTAVELADRDGLAGATLPKIAKELGFTSMSLYRYVGSKDELLVLMADAATGPAPDLAPDLADGGKRWRAGLRQWALALGAVYVRHRWLAHLPIAGPPSGPNAIGWLDACLGVLRDTGLDWGAKVGIAVVLTGYVRSTSQQMLDMEEGRRDIGIDQVQVERAYGRTMARLVDPDRFPQAAKLFASGIFESPPQPAEEPVDHDFTFGLELILDGVAAAIEVTTRP